MLNVPKSISLEDVKGIKFTTYVVATLNKDNKWEVKYRLEQSRSLDLEEWETKEITSSAIHFDLERAMSLSLYTIVNYLESVRGSLFEEDTEEIKSNGNVIKQ